MIYIIGVDHYEEQFPHAQNIPQKVEAFRDLVERVCADKKIHLIAEEWSNASRPRSTTGTTYCEDIATRLSIEYLACDADHIARAQLKIPSRQEISAQLGVDFLAITKNSSEEKLVNESQQAKDADARREAYWLNRVETRTQMDKNVLLVCGFGHAAGFSGIASKRGYQTEILQL